MIIINRSLQFKKVVSWLYSLDPLSHDCGDFFCSSPAGTAHGIIRADGTCRGSALLRLTVLNPLVATLRG